MSRRFQKFTYSAKTGKRYISHHRSYGVPAAHKHKEHRNQVIATVEILKEENAGKDITVLEVRPYPDILMVNWEEKKVIAVEVSRCSQSSVKKRSYQDTKWDRILLIRTPLTEGEERKSTYIRYRRQHRNDHHKFNGHTQVSNNEGKEVMTRDGNNKSAKI